MNIFLTTTYNASSSLNAQDNYMFMYNVKKKKKNQFHITVKLSELNKHLSRPYNHFGVKRSRSYNCCQIQMTLKMDCPTK